MENMVIPIIALAAAMGTFWQAYVSREQLKLQKEKLSNEKQENKMQRIAIESKRLNVEKFVLKRSLLSNLSSMPENTEQQEMEYIIEKGRSKKLVIFISGLGLDHSDFENHIQSFENYDCLAITTYGFQPLGSGFASIKLIDHIKLFVYLINSLIREKDYEEVNFVGFSIGADIVLRIVADNELKISVNKCIALDPNIDSSTLFISSKISSLTKDESPLEVAKQISKEVTFKNIDDWLDVHRYLIKIFDKFGYTRLLFLKDFASQVVSTYENNSMFFESLLSTAKNKSQKIILVFSDSSEHLIFKNKIEEIDESLNDTISESLKNNSLIVDIEIGLTHFDLVKNLKITLNQLEID